MTIAEAFKRRSRASTGTVLLVSSRAARSALVRAVPVTSIRLIRTVVVPLTTTTFSAEAVPLPATGTGVAAGCGAGVIAVAAAAAPTGVGRAKGVNGRFSVPIVTRHGSARCRAGSPRSRATGRRRVARPRRRRSSRGGPPAVARGRPAPRSVAPSSTPPHPTAPARRTAATLAGLPRIRRSPRPTAALSRRTKAHGGACPFKSASHARERGGRAAGTSPTGAPAPRRQTAKLTPHPQEEVARGCGS